MTIGTIGAYRICPERRVFEGNRFDTGASIKSQSGFDNPANPVVSQRSVLRRTIVIGSAFQERSITALSRKDRHSENLLPKLLCRHRTCKFVQLRRKRPLNIGPACCSPIVLHHGTSSATGITGWTVDSGHPIVAMRGRKKSNLPIAPTKGAPSEK